MHKRGQIAPLTLSDVASAGKPPAANTALSRSVRNLSQIRTFIDVPPQFVIAFIQPVLLRRGMRTAQHRSAHMTHAL